MVDLNGLFILIWKIVPDFVVLAWIINFDSLLTLKLHSTQINTYIHGNFV